MSLCPLSYSARLPSRFPAIATLRFVGTLNLRRKKFAALNTAFCFQGRGGRFLPNICKCMPDYTALRPDRNSLCCGCTQCRCDIRTEQSAEYFSLLAIFSFFDKKPILSHAYFGIRSQLGKRWIGATIKNSFSVKCLCVWHEDARVW